MKSQALFDAMSAAVKAKGPELVKIGGAVARMKYALAASRIGPGRLTMAVLDLIRACCAWPICSSCSGLPVRDQRRRRRGQVRPGPEERQRISQGW